MTAAFPGAIDASALRALSTLSQANRVLVRAEDGDTLRQQMCATIVQAGGYLFAWYGVPVDDAERTVAPVAVAGAHQGYLDEVHVSWGEGPLGRGPTGLAIRTGKTQVRNDLPPDPDYKPWFDSATARGFRSSIALPVFVRGEIDGALMVYASEVDAFDQAAQELLDDLAADLGYGLSRLLDAQEKSQVQSQLAESERRYRLLAENASDVVWQIDPDGRIRWASHSVTRVLGWEVEAIIGQTALSLLLPDQQARLVAMRERVLRGESASDEFQVRRADGTYRWMEIAIHPVPTPDGVARIAALRDIEQEVNARTQLEFALGHDQLTGLAVRRVVLERIAQEQRRMPSGAALIGVLSIGIDSLAAINQGLSYGAGDLVITSVATRLVETVGDVVRVGRGTGDEFVVLLPELASAGAASGEAERLRRAVQGPVAVADQEVLPTVSIGIAVGDRRSLPEQLLHDASLALREAKQQGRDRWVFADPHIAQEAHRRLALERTIREGLERGEFMPWFQPIVSLATGRIEGYEVLVRWRHGGQWVQPGDFLPVAEATGLVGEIDVAVMQQSIRAMATMPSHRSVAVNVSTVTLARLPYPDLVSQALASSGVDPRRLHLEVTETALLSADDPVAGAIAALAASGVRWYVDDFGTGYSSISHLRDLPVSGLKLDRSFTAGIGAGDDTCVRLADALAGLARGLALDPVAEGIETADEAAVLRAQGWVHGQGWFYGRPAPEPAD